MAEPRPQSPPRAAAPVPTVELGGIPVSRLGFEDTIALILRWMEEGQPRRVATANLDFLELSHRDPELHEALRTADLVTADGTPLVWLSRMHKRPIDERVAGSDLVPRLFAECARAGRSIYVFGGMPGVGEEVVQRMGERFPDLRIAGQSSPMVDLGDEVGCRRIAQEIRRTEPDLILVALGCPKQDLFLARYAHVIGRGVGIGIGATLDFLAGKVQRAPAWLGPLCLEWVYRLAQEPRRLGGRYARDARHMLRLLRETRRSG